MAEQNNNQQDLNQLLQVRYDKLHELQENGKDPFVITKYDVTNHSTDIIDNFETMEGKPVSIAGRMMFKRVMGKASFCNIQDLKGRIQVYVARDNIGEEIYKDFKKSDIGDIWGVKGYAFRTKTGEISIHAEEMTLLSKSLQILPEKFHGLTDTDMRYRQRYIDLIMNQESKEVFIKRSKILKEIRNFLADRDFMEVETPMLVSNAGGAAARPFETHYNALNEDVKLRISLELYLKRLIVGGLERVYEIGRVFRNEGVDTRHNPEFTLMELYQAYTDYEGMMELTESMFRYLAEKVCGSTKISYNGIEIDLGKPFTRMTMNDAIKKYTGIDFDTVADDAAAKKLAEEHHIAYEERHKKGDIINLFFEEFCEKELIQPTFIMDHPIEISPLTKKKPSDPTKVERFELFINTWEMCNAYSELNDPVDQRERFAAQDANAANIAKTTFLNHMSNDIRTPMNAIVGFTDIAMKRKPDKEVEDCLKKIRQSSEYLMTLINDVLDISRIESGKLEYKPVLVDLRDMTDTVLSIARGYMENRDLNFSVSREELKNPYVMADELRIREVLLNIISNAVKFTKDGGTISFVAENCPGKDEHHLIVRYHISDTGIGMSEEFQTRIFDEFSQENGGARTSYKGAGLGMAIAKQYVDLMGGKIEVSSRQGVGSAFTVEIPLLIAEHVLTEEKEKLRKDIDLHGLHVLLAEDNDLNAEIAIALLEEKGMIVTRTTDGKSALTQFCNTVPGTFDLILMDIMMPEMNGYET